MENQDPSETKSEEGQGEESSSQKYKVVVAGEEREVALDELLGGYQRQADYTRKTQELAQERKRLDSLVEERAAELYMKALEDQKSGDSKGGNKEPDLDSKIAEMENRIKSSEQAFAQKEADQQLESIMSDLRKKYGKMDEDKVLIQFHNTAGEADDVAKTFEDLAKKSHDAAVANEKSIIDAYIKEKTRNPFSAGETGHSTAPVVKPAKPVATFEEARERAEQRLQALRGS